MGTEIRLGVVGLRNIGRGHIRWATEVANCEVIAAADTDSERLAATEAEFGVERLYDSADALFADSDVDAVVLALPNQLHAPLTIQALEAGKHVLVEKPICRTSEEARAMIAARDRSGLTLMVGMNQRFDPRHFAIRQAIREGAIGRLQYGRTYWRCRRVHDGLWGRGDWFADAQTSGGGPLIDLGIHRLDLALFLLDFPQVASVNGIITSGIGTEEARRRGRQYGIEDGGIGLIRFADGAALELEASYFQNTTDDGQNTIFHGTRSSLELAAETPLLTHTADGTETVVLPETNDVASSCVEHFVRVLRGEEELSSTAEQGLQGLQIIEAIYRSAETGETVMFSA